jgi:hypothetical protein
LAYSCFREDWPIVVSEKKITIQELKTMTTTREATQREVEATQREEKSK